MSECPIYYPVSNYPHYLPAYPNRIQKKTSYYDSCNKPPVSDTCLSNNYTTVNGNIPQHPYFSYPYNSHSHDSSNNTIYPPYPYPPYPYPPHPYPPYTYPPPQNNHTYPPHNHNDTNNDNHSEITNSDEQHSIITETCDSIPYSESEYNRIIIGNHDCDNSQTCDDCDTVCTEDIVEHNNDDENYDTINKSVFVVKIPKKKGDCPAVQLN